MKSEEKEYVRNRVTRSQETFEDAKLTFEKGHLHSAVNRLYYACYYIVTALLFTEGLSSTKHSGVRSLFDRHWIKTKRLPVDLSRFYRDLFNHRQQADYADRIAFSRDDVDAWFQQAAGFIERISGEIDRALH
jgi:uncharacterized protein (UPF0332 family)